MDTSVEGQSPSTVAPTSGEQSPLPEVRYALRVLKADAQPWRVLRVYLREQLCEPYEALLDLAVDAGVAVEERLFAEVAELTLSRGDVVLRRLFGTVRRLDDLGADAASRLVRVSLVPRFWGLSLRGDARIFQEMDVLEIVRAVLARGGLYNEETLRVQVVQSYRKREYCVQYRETDLAFVTRLLEDEGISWYFAHEEGATQEALVLVDDLSQLRALRTMGGGALAVVNNAVATSAVETVRRLDWSRRLVPRSVTLRDYDPHSPGATEGTLTHTAGEGGGLFEYPAEYALRDWGGAQTTARDYGARLSAVRWQEVEGPRYGGDGESNATALTPGYTFQLADHARDDLNTKLAVVSVEHEGAAPDEVRRNEAAREEDRYRNRFTVIRATGPWRPPRATPRPRIEGAQTATVTGPAGEEIYTDAQGRIKVRFHWDRGGYPDSESTCWVRVAQSWGGAGWGTQFIPRIGMEVLVTFLEGNPDRPVVTGCLYNGTHPPTFPVPGDKTRSGWRTQSSLGGGGYNELSFEDLAGAEQVFMQAQRDHDEVVKRNHTRRVGVDEAMEVGRDQRLQVGNDRTEIVGGTRRERVALDQIEHIGGNSEETIEQDQTVRVTGTQYTVSLDAHRTVYRTATRVVGGHDRCEVNGSAHTHVKDDAVTRVDGNCVTVVGKHDARRTYIVHAEGRAVIQSSHLTEIASEKELILRVGATRIRITEERIEFTGKAGLALRSGNTVVELTPEQARIRSKGKAILSADSINILTDGAQVKLTEEVKITGSMVKLNPPKTDTEKDDDPKPPKPTKIDFKDQEGRPLANQRFVIHLDDGSEVAGVLDHEGKAELEIEGGGDAKITFPDVSDVKPG